MYIPSEKTGTSSNKDLIFVHGNGFTPKCYSPFLNMLTDRFCVKSMLLRPLWGTADESMIQLKDC